MRVVPILVIFLATMTLKALGQTHPPSPDPNEAAGMVTVENSDYATLLGVVWVEGHAFQVAASGEFQVSMSLTTGDYFEGTLFITNNSKAPFTFDPATIKAMAWKKSRKGQPKRIGIYTYPADEYVGDVESSANFEKAMLGLSYGLCSASAHLSASSQPGDTAVAESIQRIGDVAERQAAAGAADRIDHEVAVEGDGLMRKHTIFPGSTYGGRVMFGHAMGDTWEFDMKIGMKTFVIPFSRPAKR